MAYRDETIFLLSLCDWCTKKAESVIGCSHIYPYILPYVYAVGMIAQTGSCYLTLAVTIERYLAVCWSLKARHLCTQVRPPHINFDIPFALFTFAPRDTEYLGLNFWQISWEILI